ncbi:LuxR C-terminal-related transcriptional regulator [uncultured Nocardioides sp.]|uniref:helix-turn-helix transcriptional regulator n=1 Tax=uncultured Nocardioides sp. TaxID=198441 RepID=UPI00262D4BF0|nr:LuxR C-terminal-related transcriptional regulator [uncultured Nocardioides sp.]
MPGSLGLTLDLVTAAHGSSSLTVLAADVVAVVDSYISTTGSAMTAFDPVSERHTVLCSSGFNDAVVSHLTSPRFLCDDVGYRVLVEDASMRAICWREIQGDYAQTASPVEVFKPSGVLGGASVRLTTPDGRYTGDLHIGTTDPSLPDVACMAALRDAAQLMATATDISRRLGQLLGDPSAVDVERPAVLISSRGEAFPLPGHDVPRVVVDDPSLRTRIVGWRRGGVIAPAAFRHQSHTQWWRLRLVPVATGTIVEAEPADLPHGLTPRGIDILTLLSLGLHNAAIARRLEISERTCAHHIENVMARLDACSRTAAASMAIEEGLRTLPHP